MKRDILRNIEENMDGFSKGQRQIARALGNQGDIARGYIVGYGNFKKIK